MFAWLNLKDSFCLSLFFIYWMNENGTLHNLHHLKRLKTYCSIINFRHKLLTLTHLHLLLYYFIVISSFFSHTHTHTHTSVTTKFMAIEAYWCHFPMDWLHFSVFVFFSLFFFLFIYWNQQNETDSLKIFRINPSLVVFTS